MEGLDLPGIDTRHWTRAGGTGAGGYYAVAPDVLVAVPLPGYRQTEGTALKSLAEFNRISAERGRALSLIILVDRVGSQDAASRRVWSERAGMTHRRSLALVCSSGLARAIGSFFIGLNRPAVPTRMFREFDEALDWSSGHQARQLNEMPRDVCHGFD